LLIKIKFIIDFDFWKDLIRLSIPIGLINVLIIVYFSVNTVMISFIKGDEAVGIYSASYKLVEAIKFIPGMFVLAVFPVMSYFHKFSLKNLKKTLIKSIQYMCIIALPIAVGTTVVAHKIIFLLWGENFLQAVLALKILIWVSALSFVTTIINYFLIAINKQKISIYIIGTSLILNIFLNIALVPKFSYIGASIAVLLSQIAVLCLTVSYLYFHLKINPFPKEMIRILLAALLMGSLTYIIKGDSFFPVVFASAVIYFLLLFVLKGFRIDDFYLIKQIILK